MATDRFTGERPGEGAIFDYDEARHLAAYRYARTLAAGKRVLDAGCGNGFGTRILADVAASVVGVDYSADAVRQATAHWMRSNLVFRQLDLTAPADDDDTFDLVLNFQVVEHIDDPGRFLRGLHARLAPGGTLVLTTPNRLTSFSENPYHVREYAPAELRALLAPVFSTVTLLGVHGDAHVQAFDRARRRAVERILRLDPLGLRRLLPQWLVTRVFARLAIMVRRQVRAATAVPRITSEDFAVTTEGVEAALDLVAVCTRV